MTEPRRNPALVAGTPCWRPWKCAAHALVTLLLTAGVAAGQSFEVVLDFGNAGGQQPKGNLVEGRDGCFYGTTVAGGDAHGTIMSVCSGILKTIHMFNGAKDGSYPEAGLLLASDGAFYGTTRLGGSANSGTIFRFDLATRQLTTLFVFSGSNGAEPRSELVEGMDGRLYGVTGTGGSSGVGTVFSIQKSGSGFKLLRSFSGANGRTPRGTLLQAADGDFYGTTQSGGASNLGTIYRITSDGALTTVLSFNGSNGGYPMAGLADGRDGYFYGTAAAGGASGAGTVFRIRSTGEFQVLKSFNGGSEGANPAGELIRASDGVFYGTTVAAGGNGNGVIFKLTSAGVLTVLRALTKADGTRPEAALVEAASGRFYGTAPTDGPSGSAGTIFEITSSGSFKRITAFSGTPSTPYAPLMVARDGSLYGTSYAGGASSAGTIFRFVPGVSFEVLHAFANSDGLGPNGTVLEAADGSFYGTAVEGGSALAGTIVKGTESGNFSLLAELNTTNGKGYYPRSAPVQGPDGYLYGVMSSGGSGGAGTIYRMTAAGNVTLLHTFNGSNGSTPYGRVTMGADGVMYGTTLSGGPQLAGTIFAFDTNTSTFTRLHAFSGPDGASAYAGVSRGSDGRLYGVTGSGGANGHGTVYAYDVSARKLSTLYSFEQAGGSAAYGALVEGTDGRLYGTTSAGGASRLGTVFAIAKNGSGFTLLHSFSGRDGAYPRGGLVLAPDGFLYGTAPAGGSVNGGVIFRLAQTKSNAPAAPSNLAATAASESRVDLTWTDNSDNETGFRIERCEGSACSGFAQIGTTAADVATYVDLTVAGGKTYRYRVRAVNTAGTSSYSNIASVTTPGGGSASIEVTSPKKAVNWGIGTSQKIKWKHNKGLGATVRLQVSRDGGGSWTDIAASVPSNGETTGSYLWTVSGVATAQARLRAAFTDGSAADVSDGDFTIAAPFIKVKAPNLSTDVLTVDTTYTVKWKQNLGTRDRVKIELSLDGGATFAIVVASSTPSDGTHNIVVDRAWVTPAARMRITWVANATVTDKSSESFVIKLGS